MSTQSGQSGESELTFWGVPADPLPIFDPLNCDPTPVTLPTPVAEWGEHVPPGGLVMIQNNGVSSSEADCGQKAIVQMAAASRRSHYCPNNNAPPVYVHVCDPPVPWHQVCPIKYPPPFQEKIRHIEWIQHAAILLAMQLADKERYFWGQPVDPFWCQPSDPLDLQEAIVRLAEAIRRR